MAEQVFLVPGPSKAEFDSLSDQIETLSNKMAFGAWTTVTLPYTPTADGWLYAYLNPSSVSGAYFRLSYAADGTTIFIGQNATGGDGVTLFAPVKKGAQISQAALSNGSLGLKFMPSFA